MVIQTIVNPQPIAIGSTFQELANFLTELNGKKNNDQPLLRKGASAQLLAMHLEKMLPKTPQPIIFRRLGKHRQLALNFS